MQSRFLVILPIAVAGLLAGCAKNAPAPESNSGNLANQNVAVSSTQPANAPPRALNGDDVVAWVNGTPVTTKQLVQPLIESSGLNMLLNLVQLELAKQDAAKKGITVSPEDIAQERDDTIAHMFKDATKADYDQLLEQFLQQQHLSKPEFDLVIETNAYLRKIAEPELVGKITDDKLEEEYRSQYGETVRVRYIQCANLQEVAAAKARLGAGDAFEKVAREVSRDERTRGLGGELPPFSRATPGLPQSFKDVAFALKIGEVSDPVQAGGAYHLIKLEQRIAPKAVKFVDVKKSIRADMEDRLMQQAIKVLRNQLASQAMQSMKIEEPTLRRQFAARIDKHEAELRDREQVRSQLEKERRNLATQQVIPETNPAATTQGATNVAPAPPTTTPAPAAPAPAAPAPAAPAPVNHPAPATAPAAPKAVQPPATKPAG